MPYLFRGGWKVFGLLFLWIGKVVFFSGFICLFFVCCKFYCPLLLCLDYCMDSLFSLYYLKKGTLLFMKRIGVWVPEADKCLDEVVDRHSLQI